MPAKRPAGPPLDAWTRHAPTLSRLASKLGASVSRALRDSRPHRFAWPAAVIAALDIALRIFVARSFGLRQALQYGARVLLMAVLWGALGGLLCILLQRARRRPALFAAVLALALSELLLMCLSASHLSYYLINGHFATPELLRAVWALRAVLVAYLGELPVVTFAMLLAVAVGFMTLLKQAWLQAKASSASTRSGAWLCLVLSLSASSLIAATIGDAASLEFTPPDAAGLSLLLQASQRPPVSTQDRVRGAFLRRPLAVPKLNRSTKASNVLLILTESVRADAMCSDPHECADEYLDPVASDRFGLTRLRSQSPGTFGTCMVLWTGLEPDTEYPASHRAPLLWEVARAAGYHTLYVTAQSPDFLDFGKYLAVAGIDDLVTATELEPHPDLVLGAHDEKAMAAFSARVAREKQPWYGVLHLSNTHAMYRTDPSLQPYQQSSSLGLGKLSSALVSRYRNAIALQRRSLGAFLRELRALPSWHETIVIFLSDHGEPLGDHGQLIHRDHLFETSMRVPGWVLAGPGALSPEQLTALEANRKRLLYTRDIHATVLDALGVWQERQSIPYAELRVGRSLLRPMDSREPMVPFANISGVWSYARPHYGVAQGERKLIAGPSGPFFCFDLLTDPLELHPQAANACGSELSAFATRHFGAR
ncbi:MAG TPA: sulfatase-like hydrolase/transferase [Polyangiaceae bacterium]|nr:sulfatase-like hydrolase/transferase [Polyangiaceae bacterium]